MALQRLLASHAPDTLSFPSCLCFLACRRRPRRGHFENMSASTKNDLSKLNLLDACWSSTPRCGTATWPSRTEQWAEGWQGDARPARCCATTYSVPVARSDPARSAPAQSRPTSRNPRGAEGRPALRRVARVRGRFSRPSTFGQQLAGGRRSPCGSRDGVVSSRWPGQASAARASLCCSQPKAR